MAGSNQKVALGFGLGFLFCLLLLALLAFAFPSLFSSQACPALSGSSVLSLSFLPAPSCAAVQPLFSPGSSDELISLIRSARTSIDVEMYVFTDEALARELSEAAARGVNVRVLLEPRVNSYNLDAIATALLEGGVQVRWASVKFQLTHSKFMLIDGQTLLVGSINFSKAAQNKNREAAAVMQGEPVKAYLGVFEADWTAGALARPG